ncbi:MAG TPA: DEAD/DEAH box helicase, partial [Treponemataceae bacterium]|nr:DEAD/DEAH box helicase [Treponemataceae bacterium]
MSISSNQAQHRAPSRRGQSAATTGRSSASRRPTHTEHHVTERTYSIRDEIASLSSGRGPDRSARPAASAKSVPTARPATRPAARPASPAKRPASAKASPVQRHQRNARTQPSPQGKGRVKQYIDPARFVRKAKEVVREVYEPTHSFDDFAVDRRIIANLRAKGYVDPTPIQDQTIQLVLDGHDVVGIANTGTGKTAAFSVPLIHDLMGNRENRLLVLAPTRELAQQIVDEMESFAKGCGIRIALVIGGASMNNQ